jgi:hypothetical protein
VRRALTLFALALFAGAVVPAIAQAGDYHVYSCRDADGNLVSTQAWTPYGTVPNAATRTDTCASGGYLQVEMPDFDDRPANGTTGFKYAFPAGLTPVAYRIEMAAQTSSPPGGTLPAAGLTVGGDPATAHITDGCQDDSSVYCYRGTMTGPFDDPTNVHTGALAPGDGLAFSAICIASATCVASDVVNRARLYRSDLTFRDATDPVVSALGGSATTGGALSGHRRVTAAVTDQGSGVQRVELLVDDALVDSVAGTGDCQAPYTTPVPCPGAWNVAFDLDTTTLPDGPHALTLRAVDASGNTTDTAPTYVTVDNPTLPILQPVIQLVPGPTTTVEVPVPTPVPVPVEAASSNADPVPPKPVAVTLRAGAAKVTLPRSAGLQGTAKAADGSPKGGVALTFERRPFGGDEDDWKPAGTATTGADGSFRFPSVRQSGQIRVQPALDSVAARPLIIGFVQPLDATLHASATTLTNGDDLTLTGRVTGDGGAYAGREALVQAIVRGHWRTIDSTDIDDTGRISWDYQFDNTKQTAEYRFRVRLPAARALPWKAATTDPVTVLVTGT